MDGALWIWLSGIWTTRHITPNDNGLKMKKQEIALALRRELQAVITERHAAKADTTTHAARCALKNFQSQRMARTHNDLLMATETRAAAEFFLSDLYGAKDMTRRDADIARVIPTMEKILPAPALLTVAEAIMLDALSESLDAAMAARLGENFGEDDYIAAYREVTRRADRERQLDCVQSVGYALCDLVRIPLIGGMLKMMEQPAKLAHLSELHDFLERGFMAFKRMKEPRRFVATIVTRETKIMENLYAGRVQPFVFD